MLGAAISEIENAETFKGSRAVAAKELKRISGLDRIMFYKFDEYGNVYILAEEKESNMTTYLNLDRRNQIQRNY